MRFSWNIIWRHRSADLRFVTNNTRYEKANKILETVAAYPSPLPDSGIGSQFQKVQT